MGRRTRSAGFTLVELLTVMFIISLLIAMLVPAMNLARNAAKKTATSQMFHAIDVGLSCFKNDHERYFPQTFGYPPSFAHPPIRGVTFEPHLGQFPYIEGSPAPVVTGAHWLAMALIGLDGQGFVQRSSVPDRDNLRSEPWRWYEADPLGDGMLERDPLYVDPNGLRLVRTDQLVGKREEQFFPDWNRMKQLNVITDNFGQAVLYYAANANGRTSNMVGTERDEQNRYGDSPEDYQEYGPPIYFHQDNKAFTGDASGVSNPSEYEEKGGGWNYGTGTHPIAQPGADLNAETITEGAGSDEWDPRRTFAGFIVDRTLLRSLEEKRRDGETPEPSTPLRPVNPDSYILISAGVDGRYGTNDDVTNFSMTSEY